GDTAPTAANGAHSATAKVAAGISAGRAISMVALAFTVGSGTGALATHWVGGQRGKMIYVSRPVFVAASVIVPLGEPVPAAADPAPAEPRAPSVTSVISSPAASAPSDPLRVERVLLDEARAAFGRGDTEACLRVLASHEKRFPNGVLSEEREALAV